MILIIVGVTLYYQSHSHKDVIQSMKSETTISQDIEAFLSSCGIQMYEVYRSILRLCRFFIEIIRQFDFHYYYEAYLQFFNDMPVIATSLLIIVSIVVIIVVLFAVYAFCKFFLFISDHSEQSKGLHESHSSSSLQYEKRNSVKE